MHILAELQPWDPVTSTRPVVRACSAQDRDITGLNGQRWWPAISVLPALAMRLFDGDFSSDVEPGDAAFTVLTDKLVKLDPNFRRYRLAGAKVTLYSGESGDAWPWTEAFKGVVERFEADGNRLKLGARVDVEPFETDALTLKYAGTGLIEGDANLKNKPKPWVFGRAKNVEPVMINAVDNVFQFSGYGPIQAVNALYERAASFGASVGDYASYAALVAATIPAGRWGTCLAQGLVRLGAPPYGVITGDVDGDKPSTWLRKTGEIISRIATNAGISAGLIDSASLAALDAAVPYNVNLYLTEQTSVLDIARRLARPCNAQAGVSLLGKLFVCRIAIGTPALVLDAQGRRLPGVLSSVEADVSAPYWRLEMGAERSWREHSYDEIASYAPLVDRGTYSGSETYREGNIVQNQSSSWLYVNPTAASGNAPPTLPTTSNSWWKVMAQQGPAGATGAPGAAGANTAQVLIYRRAPASPAPTLPSATSTYTFATAAITGLNNSWTGSVPAANGDPLWVSSAVASGNSATDNIAAGEWASPVIQAQDGATGATGAPGINAATIFLFKRTAANASPAVPSATVTYTFATSVASGIDNGWSQSMPPDSDGPYLWITTAAALGTGATDTIPTGEWATPRLHGDSATIAAVLAAIDNGVIDRGEKARVVQTELRKLEHRFVQLMERAAAVGIGPARHNEISSDMADWATTGLTRTVNAAADPFGGTTAAKVVHSSTGAAERRLTESTNTSAAGYQFFAICAKFVHGFTVMRWSMDTAAGDIYWDLEQAKLLSSGRAPQGWVRVGQPIPLNDGWYCYWGIRQATAADSTDTHRVYFLDQNNSTQTSAGFTGGEVHAYRPQAGELGYLPAFFATTASDTAPVAGNATADAAVAARANFLAALASNAVPRLDDPDTDSQIFPFDNLLTNADNLAAWAVSGTPVVTRSDGYWSVEDNDAAATEYVTQTAPLTYAAGTKITLLARVANDSTGRATRFSALQIVQVSGSAVAEIDVDTDTGEASTLTTGGLAIADSGCLAYDSSDWLVWVTTTLLAASTVSGRLIPARGASASWAATAATTGTSKFLLPQMFAGTVAERARKSLGELLGAWSRAMDALDKARSEVDGTTGLVVPPKPQTDIAATSAGTIKTGELPRQVGFKASVGLADVTAAAAWSLVSTPAGITCTIGAATGILDITAFTATDVELTVRCVYAGVTRDVKHRVKRIEDPPTSSGGGGSNPGTSGSSAITATTGTSYGGANSAIIKVKAGTGGQVACAASLGFKRTPGTAAGVSGAFGKWQWRVVGGSFADITTEIADSGDAQTTADAGDPVANLAGSISVAMTKTGLTSGTEYEFQFLWRRVDVSGDADNVYASSGVGTCEGS